MLADSHHDQISPPAAAVDPTGLTHSRPERVPGRNGEQKPGDTKQWEVHTYRGRDRES